MRAAGASLKSQTQLEEVFRNSRDAMEVIVRDVRSGREVPVEIKSVGTSTVINPAGRSLGLLTETAFYGGEPALKVTGMDPNSPARRSIEPGLLILKVDGRAVGKPNELKAAVQRSRGQIEIEVVDPQDRRIRTIRVRL
jgi:S1-C subfamily serine protease